MRHYLVISDLHLCDVEEHADGWKAYKQRRFHADEAIATLLSEFAARGADGDERVLVLNGDIIDFDLVTATPSQPPWPVSRRERRRGLRPTEEKSKWKLNQVLDDHPIFVEALTHFIAEGNRVVYVLGNHDPELHFPQVAEAFVDRLRYAAERLRIESLDTGLLSFEPWFYYVPNQLYVEHGQQYDYYTSFRYVLYPLAQALKTKPPFIALPMGNLSNRYLMSQMGFFNPHASDYILNVYRYLTHWLRHYAFSFRRHLALAWFFGSLAVIGRLFFVKGCLQKAPPDHDQLLREFAAERGLDPQAVEALDALKQLPITNRVFRIIREFWIDRLAMALLMTGGTIALALVPIPLWIKLMVPLTGFPTLYFIYEWAVHGDSIFHIEGTLPEMATKVSALLPTKLVVFGHSHRPELLPIGQSVSYVNTGTWAPVWESMDQDVLAGGYRNALWASFAEDTLQDVRLESLLPLTAEGRRRSRHQDLSKPT